LSLYLCLRNKTEGGAVLSVGEKDKLRLVPFISPVTGIKRMEEQS
jgi:hypothetical protein